MTPEELEARRVGMLKREREAQTEVDVLKQIRRNRVYLEENQVRAHIDDWNVFSHMSVGQRFVITTMDYTDTTAKFQLVNPEE